MSERQYPVEPRAPAVLTVDVGGSHVKVLLNGLDERRRFVSGKKLTGKQMVDGVLELTADWEYSQVSVGVPAPVVGGRVLHDPVNLGKGWAELDYETAFGKPTKVVNDAAMQAFGSYEGGRMLFLGLGTGLGSTMILEGTIAPMELGHLPFRKATFEDYVGERGRERLGHKRWRKAVLETIEQLSAGLLPDYVVVGGGNAERLDELPRELPARAQRGRVPRRLPPLARSGVAELGERGAGLALHVGELVGRQVAAPATCRGVVRLREGRRDELRVDAEPRGHRRGGGRGLGDELLVADHHGALRDGARRGHVPAPGPGGAGRVGDPRELLLPARLDPEAGMWPERQARVVGPGALGAQPAALEERRRDVTAVADDVDRDARPGRRAARRRGRSSSPASARRRGGRRRARGSGHAGGSAGGAARPPRRASRAAPGSPPSRAAPRRGRRSPGASRARDP